MTLLVTALNAGSELLEKRACQFPRRQLAAACGISGELARRKLQALAPLGLLRRAGKARGTRYGLA